MPRVAVLNVVGLTRRLIGPSTPRIAAYLARFPSTLIEPAFPGVTCTAQSDYLTGRKPTHHGIVANGWYHRELAEVQFWKQSNHVVTAPKIWDQLRTEIPGFTCAQLFWWYNMYSTADYSITPRPAYPADGRKLFDVYSWPYDIRPAVKQELGEFPFATFWGPAAGQQSPQGGPDAASRWIAGSARWTETRYSPTLSFVYLPHLDYNLQRLGPDSPAIEADLRLIDTLVGELLDFYSTRQVQVLILSEYGITAVDTPIHLNRLFRKEGWLTLKEELGRELLDAGNSSVFAVADHQIAHIYINKPHLGPAVRQLLENTPGVAEVLGPEEKCQRGIDHVRAGDLIAVSKENAWFTYYYWTDETRAPDFARCVDIHRKPGYDPVELFLDPEIPLVKLKIARRLLQKKLGFRMLMDVIPTDATLVKGSHGARLTDTADWPLIAGPMHERRASIQSTDVYDMIRRAVLGL